MSNDSDKATPKPCPATWPMLTRTGMSVTQARIGCQEARGHDGSHVGITPDGKPYAFPHGRQS